MSTIRDRRSVLRLALAAGFSLACPAVVTANTGRRVLFMHNLHTGDSLRTVYWADGMYVPEGLAGLNTLLRDHRANAVGAIDPQLFDQVFTLYRLTGSSESFNIISGYRTPGTNAMLNKKSSGVAKKSLHMKGMAIDLRLPGVATSRLRETAISMRAGGVGYYRKSDFIHMDTGRVRSW